MLNEAGVEIEAWKAWLRVPGKKVWVYKKVKVCKVDKRLSEILRKGEKEVPVAGILQEKQPAEPARDEPLEK